MRIDEIVEALRQDMDPWIKKNRGVLTVAKDPYHALEILMAGPQGLHFVLAWGGDDPEGAQAQEPLGNNIIELSVGYALGLEADRDAALMKNRADRPSLLKLVSDTRSRLLAYVFGADDAPQFLAYGGTTAVVLPEGIPLAAYKIRATVLEKVEVDEKYRGPGADLLE